MTKAEREAYVSGYEDGRRLAPPRVEDARIPGVYARDPRTGRLVKLTRAEWEAREVAVRGIRPR